jgi:hypothetical protein
MATDQQHFDAARQFQEYYDRTLSRVGTRAPPPALGQTTNDYRRETLRQLKRTFLPQKHDLFQVQYRSLRADALDALEPQLLKAVAVEAINPTNFEPGELRLVPSIDPQTGVKTNNWYGAESFVKAMSRPGRRVESFVTQHGKYDARKAKYVA